VGRTAQAGVVGAHQRGHAVQHSFLETISFDEVLTDLANAVANRAVIVAGSNDQVCPTDGSVLIDLVVMNQGAARSLDHPDAFQRVHPSFGTYVGIQRIWFLQKDLHTLQRIQNLDQAGVMIEEGAVRDTAKTLTEFRQLGIGTRRSHRFGGIHAPEWTNTIDALRPSLGLVERSFEIGIADGGFANKLLIVLSSYSLLNHAAVGGAEAQQSVIELDPPGAVDQPGILLWE
jgi:hypothetical protein